MFQIKIKKNIGLEDVDLLYKQLNLHIKDNLEVDVLLPTELNRSYIGIVPSLYQFVFTWVRYQKSGKLLLDISNPDTTDFEELYENELIFPLICLVWNKNDIFNNSGKINLRNYLKTFNKIYFDKMKAVSAQKNRKLLLTNFDHFPKEQGILPCFEVDEVFTANETSLSNNLDDGIYEILAYSNDVMKEYNKVKEPLMGIVYELMKNTYEWGCEDENNVPLDPSTRGLLIKFYKKTRKKLIEDFKNHKGLSTYFSNERLKENNVSELYFLEIDVFDSGLGFIEKYKSLNQSNELTDIDIIKKCLIKHNTSDTSLESDDKGIGLDRILTILDGKGFLRIKTGNYTLYRNLITHPYKKIEKNSITDMELFDWKKNSNSDYTIYPNSVGAVISIIYPLASNL